MTIRAYDRGLFAGNGLDTDCLENGNENDPVESIFVVDDVVVGDVGDDGEDDDDEVDCKFENLMLFIIIAWDCFLFIYAGGDWERLLLLNFFGDFWEGCVGWFVMSWLITPWLTKTGSDCCWELFICEELFVCEELFCVEGCHVRLRGLEGLEEWNKVELFELCICEPEFELNNKK